jgi:hypothetical protein
MKIVSRRRQRGLALIMMAVMVVLGATYILISQLDSVGRRQQQDMSTQAALEEAKAALIGFAANNANRPGGLPCPDTNNDGVAEGTCTTANSRVGRLPWNTLGIADLRDASGERLWYGLSNNFRNASGIIINSDTVGQITVKAGTADMETAAIAVVIAPGNPIQGQVRSTANENLVQMYLEGRNNYAADTGGTNDDVFETAQASQTFNDKIAVVSQANLFNAVEAAVATRLAYIAKTYIFDPVKDADGQPYLPATGTSTYLGILNETEGLLPITATQSQVQWATPTVTNTGATSGSYNSGSSSCTYTAISVVCTLWYSGRPTLQVQVTAPNVAMTFAMPLSASDVTAVPGCSGSMSSTSFSPTTPTLNANGSYTVTYVGRPPTGCIFGTGNFVVTIPFPPLSAITSSTDPYAGWFMANQWYKQTYYAASSAHELGGSGSCVPGGTPACITVNNFNGTTNNKRVILLLAGRSINGTTRPSGVLADYLESQNGSILDYVFETNRPSPTFNDRVVVVSP